MLRTYYQNETAATPQPKLQLKRILAVLLATVGLGHVLAEGTVVVSMEPYREVAEALAPTGTTVRVVLPSGQSPHAYEPSPSDAAALEDAALVIYNGGLDEWMTSLMTTVGSEQLAVRAVDAAEALDMGREAHHDHSEDEHAHDEHEHDEHAHDEHEHDEHEHDEHEHDEHAHDEHKHDEHEHDEHEHDEHAHDEHEHAASDAGETNHHDHDEHSEESHSHGNHEHAHDHDGDVHVWHSVAVMKQVAANTAQALIELHPNEEEAINASLDAYQQKLDDLDEELESAYSQVQGRPIVFMHGAWDRLIERYDLNQVAIIEPFPGREPSASYLADVLETIERYEVNVIFSERQLNPRPANVIAQEANIQVAVLDPVGGGETGGYTDMMRYNAQTIVEALRVSE